MKTDITIDQITSAGHDEDCAPQVLALCAHLDCQPDDLKLDDYDHYGLALYSMGSRQYAVGTDSEADKAAATNIEESAWAFNASFLADFTGLPEEVLTAMQGKCEDSNDAIVKLIERMDSMESFVEQAIAADGRGHFMGSYDGEENEERVQTEDIDETLYIYRVN